MSLREQAKAEPKARRVGFTLIELLVVVVIIGILASIGVGAYNQAMDRSRNGGVISNVRAVALGIEQWKTDHPGLPAELVGANHNVAVAATSSALAATDFPVKYTSGGLLPPAPWSRPPQTAMDSAPFCAEEGASTDADTAMGNSNAAKVIKQGEGGKLTFDMTGGFYADGGKDTGGPPPTGQGPSKRVHYGYVYYIGETASSKYAVFGVGKNKKDADVVAVRANFQ